MLGYNSSDIQRMDFLIRDQYNKLCIDYGVDTSFGEYKLTFWTNDGYQFFNGIGHAIEGGELAGLYTVTRGIEFGIYVEKTKSWLMMGEVFFNYDPFTIKYIDINDCTIEKDGEVTHDTSTSYQYNIDIWNEHILKLNNINKLIDKL